MVETAPRNQHFDRLYGEIDIGPEVRALLSTPEFVRLHRVALDAVPH
ncbi:hypothetical protein HY388_02465 [Candidatus Daviesbacteria bacterium]|nr:hypothetical protein [Candidatus Daviesbacteria bacterium]